MLYIQSFRSSLLPALLLLAGLALVACQPYEPAKPLAAAASAVLRNAAGPESGQAVAGELMTGEPITRDAMTQQPAADQPARGDPAGEAPAAPAVEVAQDSAALWPAILSIPAIELEAEVTPMGWEAVMLGDKITTRWVVPLDTLGWAANSAEPGTAGNVVIMGHQALGAAIFRPLALGLDVAGQEIHIQTADGRTYLYRISEVAEPLPAIGATAEEDERSAAYLAPSDTARLTLVSGWPADTTTHRIFVVAEYAGEAP